VTDWKYDTTPSFIEMAKLHGLVDLDLYKTIMEKCNIGQKNMGVNQDCNAAMERFENLIEMVNIYDIYGKCYGAEHDLKLYDSRSGA
jgi:uncharacterized protein YjaG (DUF416 family)